MYRVTIINNTTRTIINEPSTSKEAPKISGSITEAINSINKFNFTIYPDNSGYELISDYVTLVEVYDTKNEKNIFTGRVYMSPHFMDTSGLYYKQVACESELGYLCDTVQPYGEYHNITVRGFLELMCNNHNKFTSKDKQFVVGQVTVKDSNDSLYRFLNYETTLDAINSKLVEKLGGEIRIRYSTDGLRYLDYITAVGVPSTTTIELGKNLQAITKEPDPTSIVTRLIPLGAKGDGTEKRLTIQSVNSGKIYIEDSNAITKYGIICKTNEWDDVKTASALMRKAKDFLANNNKALVKYSITALDLSLVRLDIESFEVGNTYRVINPIMQIDDDLRVIEKTINIESPETSTIIVGDKFDTQTNLTAINQKAVYQKIQETNFKNNNLIEQVISNATALLTGAENSHMYHDTTQGKERLLFMDAPDMSRAKNVLQINKNGIGFSQTGIDGPYTSAWTLDGTFNTDFITARTLVGLKIQNGNGTFSVYENGTVVAHDLISKNANITGGSIRINTSNKEDSIIILSFNEWTLELSPLEWVLKNASINKQIVAQAGALFFQNLKGNSETIIEHDNANFGGDIWAKEVWLKLKNSNNYFSLQSFVAKVENYMSTHP